MDSDPISGALAQILGGGGLGAPGGGGPPGMPPGGGGPPGMPPGMPGMPPGGGPPGMGPSPMPPPPPMGMNPMSMPGMTGMPMSMVPSLEMSGNPPMDMIRMAMNLLQMAVGFLPQSSQESNVVQGLLRDGAALTGGLSGDSSYPIGPDRSRNNPTSIPPERRGQGQNVGVPPQSTRTPSPLGGM